MRRTDILERKEDILKWIGEDLPNAEIARRLACKVDTLKSYYTKMGITYSGNQSGKGIKGSAKERKTAEELAKNPLVSSHKLKLRILEDGIKEHKCECCGLTSWNGKPIPLELHHIDGNHYNNDLSTCKYYALIVMLRPVIIHVRSRNQCLSSCRFESDLRYFLFFLILKIN